MLIDFPGLMFLTSALTAFAVKVPSGWDKVGQGQQWCKNNISDSQRASLAQHV